MVMILRYRCWQSSRPVSDGFGPMSVTTVPLAARHRRLLCSSTHRIERASIPSSISLAIAADAYAGFNRLYQPERKPGPITEAGCWAHARRKLFELADIASNARDQRRPTISPIAFEAVQKFDAIFMLERSINGLSPEARVAARRKDIAPLVNDLIEWMKRERAKLSRHNEVAKAMDYMLKRIHVFTR